MTMRLLRLINQTKRKNAMVVRLQRKFAGKRKAALLTMLIGTLGGKKRRKMMKKEKITHHQDLISDLPESLILAIISFLSMEDATRFGFASKRFLSACKSIPVLDFDFLSFKKTCSKRFDSDLLRSFFIDFVSKSLQLRSSNDTCCFQRLSYVGPGSASLVYKIVDFSLRNEIKELNINGDGQVYNRFPITIFSAEHITRLKIEGVGLNLKNLKLVLSCPLIEDIIISGCSGFKTMTLCGVKLKHVVLDSCWNLLNINIDPQVSLESFSYSPRSEKLQEISKISFNLDSFKLLKYLEFKNTNITDEWFQEHVSQLNLIETLKLHNCENLKNICVVTDSLKTLVLENCTGLESIYIMARNLESFLFDILGKEDHCKNMNISSSKYLKNLILRGASVTDKWIEDNLSRFLYLEHLELNGCNLLKNVEICSGKLTSLELLMCTNLSKVETEAPKLISFIYNGNLLPSPPVLISSSKLHAKLLLSTPSHITESYRRLFRDFMVSFDHCERLHLDISIKILIYPENERENMIPPLYDLKHLKVEVKWNGTNSIVQLVEGLLWLVPNPETISIILHDCDLKVKSSNLKFHYKHACIKENVLCCTSYPIKCWRHFLVEVEMDNFEDSYVRSSVQNFLMENAECLTNVIFNTH